jgi:hypothetical protein
VVAQPHRPRIAPDSLDKRGGTVDVQVLNQVAVDHVNETRRSSDERLVPAQDPGRASPRRRGPPGDRARDPQPSGHEGRRRRARLAGPPADLPPRRYHVETAHVVDSNGEFSEQIDVLIFDRQYSPFIFRYEGQIIVPAESVYAAFEAKQVIDAGQIDYAQKKVASVRRLHRPSLPIPYAEGTYQAKTPAHILGGILTLESDWKPALGEPLLRALSTNPGDRLDLGCVAAHGVLACDPEGRHTVTPWRCSAAERSVRAGTRSRACRRRTG